MVVSSAALVERQTRYLILARVAGKDTEQAVNALIKQAEWSYTSAIFVPGAPDPKSTSGCVMTDNRFKALDVRIPQAMKCIRGLGIGARELFAGRT